MKSIPEAEVSEDLPLILESIFKHFLEESLSHKIKLDRAHCVLHPKTTSAQPRDVIYCVQFSLKERIMAKARVHRTIKKLHTAKTEAFKTISITPKGL